MNTSQLECLEVILAAVRDDLQSHTCANWSEGRVKSVAVDAALTAGYSILEGSNSPGRGRRIWLDSGHLKVELERLPHMAALSGEGKNRNSPDLRVVRPTTLTCEIQVRSVFTSQSQLLSANVENDLERVAAGTADVFIGALDCAIYDALRGDKANLLGRPAMNPALFAVILPASGTLASAFRPSSSSANSLGSFLCRAAKVNSGFGVERVLFGVYRA